MTFPGNYGQARSPPGPGFAAAAEEANYSAHRPSAPAASRTGKPPNSTSSETSRDDCAHFETKDHHNFWERPISRRKEWGSIRGVGQSVAIAGGPGEQHVPAIHRAAKSPHRHFYAAVGSSQLPSGSPLWPVAWFWPGWVRRHFIWHGFSSSAGAGGGQRAANRPAAGPGRAAARRPPPSRHHPRRRCRRRTIPADSRALFARYRPLCLFNSRARRRHGLRRVTPSRSGANTVDNGRRHI